MLKISWISELISYYTGASSRRLQRKVYNPERLTLWREARSNVRRRSWKNLQNGYEQKRRNLCLHCGEFAKLWWANHPAWGIHEKCLSVSLISYIVFTNAFSKHGNEYTYSFYLCTIVPFLPFHWLIPTNCV